MAVQKKVNLLASFDPNRRCWEGLGDGSCYLKLNTSESELAKVLTAFAFLRYKLLKVTFEVVGEIEKSKRKGNKNPKQKTDVGSRKSVDK